VLGHMGFHQIAQFAAKICGLFAHLEVHVCALSRFHYRL
jgi:hypothetical protein